ncbi:MAG: hypothetical protein H0W33_02870 [Gammaproteobacteria bacterium]|nr:hypothetical protein [Gammaproteobacteria bacterium]
MTETLHSTAEMLAWLEREERWCFDWLAEHGCSRDQFEHAIGSESHRSV